MNKLDEEKQKLLLHSVKDTVREQETKITNLQSAMSQLSPTTISTLQANVNTLQTDVDTLETNLATLQTSQVAISNRMEDAETDISNLGDVVETLSDSAEVVANKTNSITQNSNNTQYPTALAVYNFMEENMIDTTDLENGLDELTSSNSSAMNSLGTKLDSLTVAVRGIGADFTQVDATQSDVKSGKKFFNDDGELQTGTIPTYSGATTITENGEVQTQNTFVASNITVSVARPQLNAPTISISNDTLTLTSPASNGNFATGFKVFSNSRQLCQTTSTSINLADYFSNNGTYTITAVCYGANCVDSVQSSSATYIVSNVLGTSVSQITSLLTDYETEFDFNTSAEEKLQFGTRLGNSPCAKVWFRQKPTNLTSEQIVLNFFITGLSSPSAIPALIKLNGTTVFSDNLTLVSNQSHIATCTVNISSGFVAFNELTIEFTDSTQASACLDFLSVAITGTQNCIILNRDTTFEMYGLKRTSGVLREYARMYVNGGYNYFVGGEDQDFTTSLSARSFSVTSINNETLRYAMSYLMQDFSSSAGYTFVASSACYEIFITQSNKLYAMYTNMSSYNQTYISNVNYAKKSLHNGSMTYLEYICCSFQDFSVGIVPFIESQMYVSPTLTSLTLNNQTLSSEFIDIIPVNNYIVSVLSSKIAVGYFLLHKSGNILFVPNVNSEYFFIVGKGRQVTAFLQEGGNEIHVYYNVGDTVIKKTLTRTSLSADWNLSDESTTYSNAKAVYERATGTTLKFYNGSVLALS